MSNYVTKEVFDAKLEGLHDKLNDIVKLTTQCLQEQRITNGKVQRHEVQIQRIWAIGATLWAAVTAVLGWKVNS